MRFFRIFLLHEGVLGIGRLVISLFRRSITFCKECKLCSRWHWLRYRRNDQWSWWIAWVPICSQRCKWKDMLCMVRVRGWSAVWNAILTKKLPLFLSRFTDFDEKWPKRITPPPPPKKRTWERHVDSSIPEEVRRDMRRHRHQRMEELEDLRQELRMREIGLDEDDGSSCWIPRHSVPLLFSLVGVL